MNAVHVERLSSRVALVLPTCERNFVPGRERDIVSFGETIMLRIRRAHSVELRDKIFALRYRAYRQQGSIDHRSDGRFSDAYDAQPNHILWALTQGDQVVGSIRTTWYDPGDVWSLPELEGYGDDVRRHTPPGARLFSGSRFVTEPGREDRDAHHAMLLLRVHLMTFQLRQCDWALAAVRKNHLPFYRRVLHLSPISEGRPYPGLKSIMHLTACHFPTQIEQVYRRTPELRASANEHLLLDDYRHDAWEDGVEVTAS